MDFRSTGFAFEDLVVIWLKRAILAGGGIGIKTNSARRLGFSWGSYWAWPKYLFLCHRDCCTKKKIGGKIFRQVLGGMKEFPDCQKNCVYEEENHPGVHYCLMNYQQPMTCLGSYSNLTKVPIFTLSKISTHLQLLPNRRHRQHLIYLWQSVPSPISALRNNKVCNESTQYLFELHLESKAEVNVT